MTNLEKLIRHFEQFPGIGGRQARRFAFHILTLDPKDVDEISFLITSMQDSVAECSSCRRFFSKNSDKEEQCSICTDGNRDHKTLMVVERDSDVQAIERSGTYDGFYFVLGGTVSLLNSDSLENTSRVLLFIKCIIFVLLYLHFFVLSKLHLLIIGK